MAVEEALPPCPPWCAYDAPDHGWMGETDDGRLVRQHLIDFGVVTASSYTAPIPARQPEAHVALVQEEDPGGGRGPLLVALNADYYPHLTPSEARQVAAALTSAADRADAIAGG